MIDGPKYMFSPFKIKVELMARLVEQGEEIGAAFEFAQDCVDAGKTTPYWREQIGDKEADALDKDLERFMTHDRT